MVRAVVDEVGERLPEDARLGIAREVPIVEGTRQRLLGQAADERRLLPYAPALIASALVPPFGATSARAENRLPATELILPERRAVVEQGEVLPPVEFDIGYTGGSVVLSGDGASTASFWVDD